MTLILCFYLDFLCIIRYFVSFAAAAAVPAGLRGSLPAGGPDLHLPPAEPGDPLRLLPARLHHPSLPEPGRLRLPGRALQEVLAPVPVLSRSEPHSGPARAVESCSSGVVRPTHLSESCRWVLGPAHTGSAWKDSRTSSLDLFGISTFVEWSWRLNTFSNTCDHFYRIKGFLISKYSHVNKVHELCHHLIYCMNKYTKLFILKKSILF